jgi:hypothetical protein
VSDLGSTAGIVALAAAAVALVAFVLAIVLAVKLRRMRAAQSIVLGDSGTADVAEHARRLQDEFTKLAGRLDSLGQRFEARVTEADRRLDGAIAHFAVVRYDAYNEMSGRQSSSIALLDSHRTGIVLSSILHREQARLYAKQIVNGRPQLDLSPEEQEAVDAAIAGEHRTGESAAG